MLLGNHCLGSKFATYPECDDLGYVQEVRGSGEMETHACGGCHGRKSARCDNCGGIGWLGADNVVSLPVEYGASQEEVLAGYRDGGRAELVAIERLAVFTARPAILCVPRDFDICPHFTIVKPEMEAESDFRRLRWTVPSPSVGPTPCEPELGVAAN